MKVNPYHEAISRSGSQQNVLAFYGSFRFITVLTTARHWSTYQFRQIKKLKQT